MGKQAVWILAAALGLMACQGAATDKRDAEVQAATPSSSATGGAKVSGLGDLESKFSKGMAYGDMRQLLLDAGWKPVVDPECEANVVGGGHVQQCAANPTSDSCMTCRNMPETSSCSGDGFCGMYFGKAGATLHVVTYGMTEDWNVIGSQSRLEVDGWGLE